MTAVLEQARKVWTEAQLEALPDDGFIHEVVNGELVMSPKNNFQHEELVAELLTALREFAKRNRLGKRVRFQLGVLDAQSELPGARDVFFICRERLEKLGFRRTTRRFLPGAPDLAVEILSPSNTRAEIDERLRDFFASGTQIAWIINPDEECAEVCHSLERRQLIGPGGFLDGEHLLPGFRYPLADLFKEWDWE